MFTLSQYLSTLSDPRGLTRTLGDIEVCRGPDGRICCSAGNTAAVFRIRHEGRIRSLRCYLRPAPRLREIYGDRLLEKELWVYRTPDEGTWADVVVGDWIEGDTLQEVIEKAAACRDRTRLSALSASFDSLAASLVSDRTAHGDLKPENIIVASDGTLHPIDFDAAFLPAFAGARSPELGTAAYQHPARTADDFDASLDDYPAALIATALHALRLDPSLYDRFGERDGLLFEPQQIAADAALDEALARFEAEGLAAHYRIARLLYAPTLRLPGLCDLLTRAVEEIAWTAPSATAAPTGAPVTPVNTPDTAATDAPVTQGVSAVTSSIGSTPRNDPASGCTIPQADPEPGDARMRSAHDTPARTGAAAPDTPCVRPALHPADIPARSATAPAARPREHRPVCPELFVENGLWGYRTADRIVIPPLYDCGFDFSEGVAAVRLGHTWHFIDTAGRTAISCPDCEAVKPFRRGRAVIVRDGIRGEIDHAGREFAI